MPERLLSVSADLTIDVADQQVRVRDDRSDIIVEVPTVALAFGMMRDLGKLRSVRENAARIVQTLSDAGLTVVVRTPGRRLFTMGRGGNSWLLRLFGVPNARMHLR